MPSADATPTSIAEDLQYVRASIRRKTFSKPELLVALVWALINLVGLSLYDLSLAAGGIFWLIALPLFGIGTGVWAAHREKARGNIDRDLGRRHGLHWSSIPLFLLFANALFAHRGFDPVSAGQIVLIIVGLVYYLGGVHFWRGYLFAGIALASGAVWLLVLPSFPWTLTGILTCLAISICALYDWKRHAAEA